MGRKQERTRAKRWIYRGMALLFLALVFGLTLGNLIKRDRDFSEMENRMLEQKPKLSLSAVADGSYMEKYETYQADQFAGRDVWMTVKTNMELLLGKRESNGVFLGEDGCLMEKIVGDGGENVAENIEAINDFAAAGGEMSFYFLAVPNAAEIWKDKLPAFAVTNDQKAELKRLRAELSERITWVDAYSVMESHADEKIYYDTDHHWTTLAASYVFQELKDVMKLDKSYTIPYEFYAVTNSFQGTLSAKSGYETGKKETIYVALPGEGEGPEIVVHDVGAGEKSASLYKTEKLEERDKYAMFLGGNSPLLDIQTTSDSERKLLIFKDSYANCLISFLMPYFRQILVADPRYYYDDVRKLADENGVTDVLFLYNGNTFFEDNSLAGVLAE